MKFLIPDRAPFIGANGGSGADGDCLNPVRDKEAGREITAAKPLGPTQFTGNSLGAFTWLFDKMRTAPNVNVQHRRAVVNSGNGSGLDYLGEIPFNRLTNRKAVAEFYLWSHFAGSRITELAEVRDGETPSPAPETGALPGKNDDRARGRDQI